MNQKVENLLNLSLQSTESERQKSLNLDAGAEDNELLWEVIIKYQGNADRLRGMGFEVEELINGYAIVTLPPERIENLAETEEVEYIEMPKHIFYQTLEGRRSSCITQVTDRSPSLSGRGILIAVFDSGIDFSNSAFRNEDGTTRFVSIWDQTLQQDSLRGWFPPVGFQDGVELNSQQINDYIELNEAGETPAFDVSGHGTSVTGIAAAREANSIYLGVAPESSLLFVKLGNQRGSGFPRTTELMRAVTYALRKSRELNLPLVINLSLGFSYGNHEGDSLLERFLDNASEIGKTSVVVASGNEGAADGHFFGKVEGNVGALLSVEMSIAEYESVMNLQIWKSYRNDFEFLITSPSGEEYVIPFNIEGVQRITLQDTQLLIFVGVPLPYETRQEIYIDFIPLNSYIDSGIWTVTITNQNAEAGEVDMYLPSSAVLNEGTGFFRPSPYNSFTIPSTAGRVITVGAYDTRYISYASFSGRGAVYTSSERERLLTGYVKPEIVAPGVDIQTISARGGFITVSGTSFAAPFVSGSAALMMEWGIVRGNDPFLYGEKLKAYLIKGAKQLPGLENPNSLTGDCVKLVLG